MKTNKLLPGVIFLAAVLIRCGGGDRPIDIEKNGLERLMGHLQEENVAETPFSGLMDRFVSVGETFSGDISLMRTLSTSRQKVWAVTTEHPALGYDESQKPPEMEVWMGEQSLEFYSQGTSEAITWKWIQTARKIDLRFDGRFNKARKCLVLEPGNPYHFEAFLPRGPASIEILAERNKPPVHLEVSLNGEFHSRHPLQTSPSTLRLNVEGEPGIHSFSVNPVHAENKGDQVSENPKVSVHLIKVETKNDLVLFFVPAEKQNEFSREEIRLRYLHSPAGQSRLTSLVRIQNDFVLHSYSRPENPYGLKKKMEVENSSLDVLLAPSSSRYTFKVKIPGEASLEFGTGVFRYAGEEREKSICFQIIAAAGESQHILYERTFHSTERMRLEEIEPQRISLSRYAGQTVHLTLLTDDIETQDSEGRDVPAFAFWVNPLIYRPAPGGLKVILVSLDTLRADHLSSYGYSRKTSPHLDRLAEDSVLFEHAFAQSPWTLPSHLSLLFSLNSASHQVYLHNQSIDSSIPSLASHLKGRGYLTGAFTGGGYMSSIYGFPKGFDRYDEPADNLPPDFRAREAEYLFNTAAAWLNHNWDKKFFLFLHTFQIHGPYECPSPWNESFLAEDHKWKHIDVKDALQEAGNDHSFSPEEIDNIVALYDGGIKYTDEILIKSLVEHLKKLGIYDQTVLIITSDHGEEFYDHNGWLHGYTLYNEQLKVPLIIKLPHSQNPGSRIPAKVRLIDVMPTILELASIKPGSIDGESLLDMINGKESRDRVFISDLASADHPQVIPLKKATSRNELKFIINQGESGPKSIEIYHLDRDRKEKNNLFPKAQKLTEEVLAFLKKYYDEKEKQHRPGRDIELNQELEEKLKALGYLR